ncbi:MAG: hypothetical protein ACOCP8_08850 [archaeon]
MFLFEYLIKLLMGNSDAHFIGLLVVLFGYYGWLLWNQNNSYKNFYNKWEKHNENFVEVRKIVYNLDSKLDNISNNLDKSRIDILKEMEKESEEIKEMVKILLGYYRKMQKNDK